MRSAHGLVRPPVPHRVARRLAAGGLRGASRYWRLARALAPEPEPGGIVLGDGTPIIHEPSDWTSRGSYEGTYEREILRLLPRLLRAGEGVRRALVHDAPRARRGRRRAVGGKGLVQAVFGLGDGSGLVLTVARYQTPAHTAIQGIGVPPDVVVNIVALFCCSTPRALFHVHVQIVRYSKPLAFFY